MMAWLRWLAAAALCALAAACGGSGQPADSPTLPQAAPLAQGPAIVSIDASTFMNWAEGAYAAYFPGTQPDRQSGSFIYRYYPSTGNYLGVAGDAVYILGPVSGGALTYVADLSAFACRVSNVDCAAPGSTGQWTFVFSPDVSTASRSEFVSNFTRARAVLDAAYGTGVPQLTVFAISDLDRMMEIYSQKFPSASADSIEQVRSRGEGSTLNYLFQHTQNADWLRLSAAARFEQAIAHTYGHLLHNTLGAGRRFSPVWLLEGFATYGQYLAAESEFGTSFATNRQSAWLSGNGVASLASVEERSGMNAAGSAGYALGMVAVDYLTTTTPGGMSATLSYFRALDRLEWRQAFQQSYGRSAEQFYAEFETWRAATRAATIATIRGVVVDAAGQPRPGYNVYACIHNGSVAGACQGAVAVKTDTSGAFSLGVVPGQTYFLPINNATAGNAGFLGFYSATAATGLTTNGASATVLSAQAGREVAGLRIVAP